MAAVRELVPDVDVFGTSLDPSEAVLRRFLNGQEETAELLVRLAMETGQSLVEIYEQIRTSIAGVTGAPDVRALRENELDEALVRLVARVRAPVSARPVWSTCVLATEGRGVAACISHLMIEAGIASLVVPAVSGERSTMSRAATIALLIPSLDHLVIDGSRAHTEAISRCLRLVQRLGVAGSQVRVILLADPDHGVDPSHRAAIPDLTTVGRLSELMTAVGIATGNPLTGREREVLRHVATGATNEQVARRLGVAVSTVKTYLERIQVKLKSRDRASAVATAMVRKWL
jgi:DNA-binding CsgD family transcriptional regulator